MQFVTVNLQVTDIDPGGQVTDIYMCSDQIVAQRKKFDCRISLGILFVLQFQQWTYFLLPTAVVGILYFKPKG